MTTDASTSHLSNVWFQVTGLDVASGDGSWVTTVDGTRYLDFTGGIAVTSTGHSHPAVVDAISRQATRFIHAQANCYRHDLLEPLASMGNRRASFTSSRGLVSAPWLQPRLCCLQARRLSVVCSTLA